MLVQAFNIVLEACMRVWDLFVSLRTSFGFGGLLFSFFVIIGVYRFILAPLFNAASSDWASSSWKKIKGDSSSRSPRIKGQKAIKGSNKK